MTNKNACADLCRLSISSLCLVTVNTGLVEMKHHWHHTAKDCKCMNKNSRRGASVTGLMTANCQSQESDNLHQRLWHVLEDLQCILQQGVRALSLTLQ